MINEQINKLSDELKKVASYFEEAPFGGGAKFLKDDIDLSTIDSPNDYLKIMEEMKELLRQSRILFLRSVLDKVCLEENKLYLFDFPYQAGMAYDAVIKQNGSFFLRDEDGHYREIFSSEEFVSFVDDQYWELYQTV
ncbi:hypothetical protein [Sphingobacterium faecale]|uniref:SMI1/KNR4 family protein n=1 Tax=Sphingobacterium faecale TaxID=2803775 RepID=A0ABS1R1X9_9SPHI|nr:hypothetical protein [Sphingobacterium faecale]MBL1408703.1 hypothetical protein [Sphingobacterium faecale]